MKLTKWRAVAIIVLAVIIFLGILLIDRDRVGPAIAAFRTEYAKDLKILKAERDNATTGFDKEHIAFEKERAKIKPIEGLEAQHEALNALGYLGRIADCK